MATYIVHVYHPDVFEIEAETAVEAEVRAVELWKAERTEDTWITPIAEAWLKPQVYIGKSMHETELEKEVK